MKLCEINSYLKKKTKELDKTFSFTHIVTKFGRSKQNLVVNILNSK